MKGFLLVALCGFTAQAAAQATVHKSDWEEEQERLNWTEADVRLPPYPKGEGLIEFSVSMGASFRFFIDPASLSSGPDGVVRYTLVARSPSGFANVSYEGIRCAAKTYRVYARGSDGLWATRHSEWREIEPKSIQRWHNELYSQYLCPRRRPIENAAEGVNALREGGHPALAAPDGNSR